MQVGLKLYKMCKYFLWVMFDCSIIICSSVISKICFASNWSFSGSLLTKERKKAGS